MRLPDVPADERQLPRSLAAPIGRVVTTRFDAAGWSRAYCRAKLARDGCETVGGSAVDAKRDAAQPAQMASQHGVAIEIRRVVERALGALPRVLPDRRAFGDGNSYAFRAQPLSQIKGSV